MEEQVLVLTIEDLGLTEFHVSDYLDNAEAVGTYLIEVMKDDDDDLLAAAIEDIREAIDKFNQ